MIHVEQMKRSSSFATSFSKFFSNWRKTQLSFSRFRVSLPSLFSENRILVSKDKIRVFARLVIVPPTMEYPSILSNIISRKEVSRSHYRNVQNVFQEYSGSEKR